MITTRNLSISYLGRPALRDVNLEIPRGEVLAIVGPSGCGKSSFLSALNRLTDLVPEARVTGQVMVDGQDIFGSTQNRLALRRKIGMIFQRPNPFAMSVRRNMELAQREFGVRNRDALETRSRTALQAVGLWDEVQDRMTQSALQLSGGQQQRLCIARALALEPEVLLLDEPCSSLDPISSQRIETLIRDLRDKLTVVIVTHNLAQARRVADRVAVFWTKDQVGQLIESGETETIFSRPSDPLVADYLQGRQG